MPYLTLTPLDTVLYIDAINIDLLQNKVASRLCKCDMGHMKDDMSQMMRDVPQMKLDIRQSERAKPGISCVSTNFLGVEPINRRGV